VWQGLKLGCGLTLKARPQNLNQQVLCLGFSFQDEASCSVEGLGGNFWEVEGFEAVI